MTTMACNCDALKAEVFCQRELMAEWFQMLMVEIRDVKAELVELIKSNTFNVIEQPKVTDQSLTGQESSITEAISASAFLESINSPLQYGYAVSDSNPVSLSLEPTITPETEQASDPTFEKELISPKIEPTAEKMSVGLSITQDEHTNCANSNEQVKITSELRPIFGGQPTNLSATVTNEQFKSVSAVKPFACDQCEYRCTEKWHLIRHRHSHTDEESLRCWLCQKEFKRKQYLRDHMKVHSEEKPLNCERCNFRCRKPSDLVRHKRCHTGEKRPFACDQCVFSADTKSKLKLHKRRHTGEKGFACDQCSFAAYEKYLLKSHQRIHTGEKPFACNQCDFRSSQKGNLVNHQRVHTGEKPYQCEFCDFKAATRSTIINHSKHKHNNEKVESLEKIFAPCI